MSRLYNLLINESINDKGRLKAVFMAGNPGTGKAQPLSSMILTDKGWVHMKDVDVGTKVITPDNTISTVIQVHPQGIQDVYKIKTLDGRETRCTLDHLWKVHGVKSINFIDNNGKKNHKRIWSIEKTKDLLDGFNSGKITNRCHLPTTKPIEFSNKYEDLLINPYILGVLIGDGCITTNSLGIVSSDKEIINKINSNLFDNHYINKRKYKYSYSLISKGQKNNLYTDYLKEYNLFGKKSSEKFIPQVYKNSSIENRLLLLQGLFDTDGSSSKNGQVYFYSTSKQLIDDVSYIILSLGDIPFVKVKKMGYKKDDIKVECKDCYSITVQSHNPEKYFSLNRKINRVLNSNLQKRNKNHNLRNKIISIIPDGREECKCITLDNSEGLYLTDNFIVTHNSYVLSQVKCGTVEPRVVNVDKWIEFYQTSYSKFYDQSKKLTISQLYSYINGILPLAIDTTSAHADSVIRKQKILETLGYDTAMVFVSTSLETSLERARTRKTARGFHREVPEDEIKKYYDLIQKVKNTLKSNFSLFIEVNNNDGDLNNDVIKKVFNKMSFFYNSSVKNPVGIETLDKMIETKQKYLIPEIFSESELKSIVNKWYSSK